MVKAINLYKAMICIAVFMLCTEQKVYGLDRHYLSNNILDKLSSSLFKVQKQFFHRTYPQLPVYTEHRDLKIQSRYHRDIFLFCNCKDHPLRGFWSWQMGSLFQRSISHIDSTFDFTLYNRTINENLIDVKRNLKSK